MSTQIVVLGPPKVGSGPPPLRKEINDLIADKRQWSLYIQAIAELQKVPESDDLSWYAMAGIHGRPFQPWNNVQPPTRQGHYTGYCAHGTQTFPTWHRPYVSLFEQALVGQAIKIANGYTQNKEQWITAAQTLRAPFWDWGLNIVPPPELYVYPTLQITTKDGDLYVANPMLSYKFTTPLKNDPPSDPKVYEDRATWRAGPPSDMKDRLLSYKTMKSDVFKTLMFTHTWQDFSNYGVKIGNKPVANSLEALHGAIHDMTGGGTDERPGYMAWVPTAGFDPLFFLHHSNVDHLIALWQGLNPGADKWVSEENDPRGTNLHTPLTPFRPAQDQFYTSATPPARIWQDLNFNYPEFKDLVGASPEAIKIAIHRKIMELYGPDLPRSGSLPSFKDWFARVHTPTYGLGGSYTIYLFFGSPPTSTSEWRTAENLVGVGEVFANPDPENCENCSADPDSLYELIINLTLPLQVRNKQDQPEEAIKQYIQQNLQWRVQKINGLALVDPRQISSLRISVESTDISFEKGDTPRGPGGGSPLILPSHKGLQEHLILAGH